MSSALIGLFGVVVGALLSGIAARQIEQSKRRDRALMAGRLIAAELDAVIRRLQAASEAKAPWPGALRTARWDEHAADVTPLLSRRVLDALAA